jgi:hypothetical protein
MGRKGAKEQRNLARDEFNYQRKYLDEQRGERKAGKEQLMPEYMKLYEDSFKFSPEGFQRKLFSPKQRSNILSTGVRSARIPYENAMSEGKSRMARTGNTAGWGSLLSELTRGKSRSMADVTRRAETDLTTRESEGEFNRMGWLEDERLKRRLGGLGGLAALFGIDTQLLASTAGGGNRALGSHAAGIEPGLMENLVKPLVAGAGAGAGAFFGAGGGGNKTYRV